jgi:hypothetical protein
METLFRYYFNYFTKNNRYNSKIIVTRFADVISGISEFLKCINYSVLLNVRISNTFVHLILIEFKEHF